jgi:hypothetical protein
MPDISMCANEECSLSWNCWRFNAPPSYRQAYGDFKPDEQGNCKYYWPLEKVKPTQNYYDSDMDDLLINKNA